MDVPEILIGIAEIAIALGGFTGVVVAFGSRREGAWHPGDRLRLGFLLEASLTAAGFALLGLLLIAADLGSQTTWMVCSAAWAAFMVYSLVASRVALKVNQEAHGDIDRFANRVTATLFIVFIALQVANVLRLQELWPFLAGLVLNLAGAAMQFARLIRSAFSV